MTLNDAAKYLIHAAIRTSGVVERSDVVGAIFGQTEGLLGDELDLRDLQESSKVGRIDVDIDSEGGRSFGSVTVASGLDRAETAVLAAALETIDRVGPCRAEFTVTEIEDARAAKRRELVDRATELLAEFEASTLTSDELVDEVRKRARVEDITEYEGYPAGPRVADSDAVIVVEGRADVRQLLGYGIKNAVAVEGTDVPEPVAALTEDRTVTTFLDGDRGGELILRELAQVGSVDYVAFAPAGEAVEDLSRDAVLAALREKVPYEEAAEAGTGRERLAGPLDADGGTAAVSAEAADTDAGPATGSVEEPDGDASAEAAGTDEPSTATASAADGEEGPTEPETLAGHVTAVAGGSGLVRLLDADAAVLAEEQAEDAFEAVESADPVPASVVLDGPVTQRLLDVAAQRGVGQVVGTDTGPFVKQPTSVRVRTAAEF